MATGILPAGGGTAVGQEAGPMAGEAVERVFRAAGVTGGRDRRLLDEALGEHWSAGFQPA